MKKSVFLSVVLSLLVLTCSFAGTSNGIKSGEVSKISKAAPALSEEEVNFFNALDDYYFQTFEKPAQELCVGCIEENNIIVYNLEGKVITTNKNEIPVSADLLMRDGDTIFYIVY